MRNVLDKNCRENQNTHFIFNNFFRKSHRLWDNIEKYSGDRGAINDITIWRIRVAWWISKAISTYAHAHARVPTCTHARTRRHADTDQYVIRIAFPQQQWFRKRTSLLRYTYIACLSCIFLYSDTVLQNVQIQPRQGRCLSVPALLCGMAPELHSTGCVSYAAWRLYKIFTIYSRANNNVVLSVIL